MAVSLQGRGETKARDSLQRINILCIDVSKQQVKEKCNFSLRQLQTL